MTQCRSRDSKQDGVYPEKHRVSGMPAKRSVLHTGTFFRFWSSASDAGMRHAATPGPGLQCQSKLVPELSQTKCHVTAVLDDVTISNAARFQSIPEEQL
jgi:hypothetical protein